MSELTEDRVREIIREELEHLSIRLGSRSEFIDGYSVDIADSVHLDFKEEAWMVQRTANNKNKNNTHFFIIEWI